MRQALERVMREAGKLALEQALRQEVHTKGRGDFVTDADLAVSDYLGQALTALIPGSRMLSEEGSTEESLRGKLFIVDPIDGTTNLMYGLRLSALSAAYWAEDGLSLAAVYNPFTDEMFSAEKGKGATLNGQPIRVNEDDTLECALVGAEAGPATAASQKPFFDCLYTLHACGRGMRFTGSAALDLAYVASGRLSAAVFHYLFPWDYAAGWLLLNEAGGRLTDKHGEPLPLQGRSTVILASNTRLHPALQRVMGEA